MTLNEFIFVEEEMQVTEFGFAEESERAGAGVAVVWMVVMQNEVTNPLYSISDLQPGIDIDKFLAIRFKKIARRLSITISH